MGSGDRPLSPLSLAVLLTVAAEPLHGYGIMSALDARPGPRLVAGAGSLYAALDRMVDEGLLHEEPDVEDARRTRRFSLTARGRRAAQAELRRLEALVAEGRAHRLLPGRP